MNSVVSDSSDLAIEREATLGDYFEVIKRRRKQFIATAAFVLTLALGLAFGLPPVYRSSALVLIEQQDVPTELVRSAITTYADERIQIIRQKVMTNANLTALIEKLELFDGVGDIAMQQALVTKLSRAITIEMLSAEMLSGGKARGGKNANIAFKLNVDFERDPIAAQKIAAEMVAMFMRENIDERTRRAENAAIFLANEVSHAEKTLRKLESDISDFKAKNIGILPEQIVANVTVRERLERELFDIDQKILAAQQRNFILESDIAKMPRFLEYPEVKNELGESVMSTDGRIQVLRSELLTLLAKYSTDHPNIRRIRNEMIALGGNPDTDGSISVIYGQLSSSERELESARRMYTPEHPEVQRLEQQVRSLRSEVGKNRRDALSGDLGFKKTQNPSFLQMQSQIKVNNVEVSSLQSRRAQVSGKIRETESQLVKAPTVEREYMELQRQYAETKTTLNETTKKLREAQVSETLESEEKGERLTLLEAPVVAKAPYKPNRPAFVAVGFALALGIAFALVMFLESMDRSVASRHILATLTGMQPIGVIPLLATRSEIESMSRRNAIIRITVVVGILIIVAAATYVHMEVVPLNQILDSTASSFDQSGS